MPFMLEDEPVIFERFMELALYCRYASLCLCYSEDSIIRRRTIEEHMDNLRRVFEGLIFAGLVLDLGNCVLANGVIILGHLVLAEAIIGNPEKAQGFKN